MNKIENKVSFFTAIEYSNQPKTLFEFTLETIDDYFYFSGKKARVVSKVIHKGSLEVIYYNPPQSSKLLNVIKVCSYITLIIPTIMLIAKAIFRSVQKFHAKDPNINKETSPNSPTKNLSTPQKIKFTKGDNNLSRSPSISDSFSPQMVRPGLYQTKIMKNGEPIYLHMELIDEKNCKHWERYKIQSSKMSEEYPIRLYGFIKDLTASSQYTQEDMNEFGFSVEEFEAFKEQCLKMKDKPNSQIVNMIKENRVGSGYMIAKNDGKRRFIVYATTNPNFSIEKTNCYPKKTDLKVKEFFDCYKDILISFGSDFSHTDSTFQNRGISRNPYWMIQDKYSGLSMLLHGFSGAVAEKFFPVKNYMMVKPISSMQAILKKKLKAEDGYVDHFEPKEKIGFVKTRYSFQEAPMKPGHEAGEHYIKTSALSRLFLEESKK